MIEIDFVAAQRLLLKGGQSGSLSVSPCFCVAASALGFYQYAELRAASQRVNTEAEPSITAAPP